MNVWWWVHLQDHNIRDGWVSLGIDLPGSNYDKDVYLKNFERKDGHLLGATDRIEQLRPKSPPRKGNAGRGNRTRGRGIARSGADSLSPSGRGRDRGGGSGNYSNN